MKDQEFQNEQGILLPMTKSWDDLTFAEVQSVFCEWIEGRTWFAEKQGRVLCKLKTSL
jgi:hypothetical protein